MKDLESIRQEILKLIKETNDIGIKKALENLEKEIKKSPDYCPF